MKKRILMVILALALLLSLSFLVAVRYPQIMNGVYNRRARAEIARLEFAIETYYNFYGAYPPSSFEALWGDDPAKWPTHNRKISHKDDVGLLRLENHQQGGSTPGPEEIECLMWCIYVEFDSLRPKRGVSQLADRDGDLLPELLDPWGNPWQYKSPSEDNPEFVDIWSLGPGI